jgi:hypothetical protein
MKARCTYCGLSIPHESTTCRTVMKTRVKVLERGIRQAAGCLRRNEQEKALNALLVLIPQAHLHLVK